MSREISQRNFTINVSIILLSASISTMGQTNIDLLYCNAIYAHTSAEELNDIIIIKVELDKYILIKVKFFGLYYRPATALEYL